MARSETGRTTHYLSFDVEDWFHVPFVSPYVPRAHWDCQVSIVDEGTRTILEVLDTYRTKATFFVLGTVAEKHPDLLQDILEAGHEVGIHGNEHVPVGEMAPAGFSEDIRAAVAAVEDVTGVHPVGYRAPLCSIGKGTLWALDVLRAAGLRYDSSLYPASPAVYAGLAGVPDTVYEIIEGFYEVPLSCETVLGVPFPLSGGFYLRLSPLCLFWRLLARRDGRGQSAVLYYHPWEFAVEYPRLVIQPAKRFIQYHNLKSVKPKLERLLSTFRFRPLRESLPNWD